MFQRAVARDTGVGLEHNWSGKGNEAGLLKFEKTVKRQIQVNAIPSRPPGNDTTVLHLQVITIKHSPSYR